MPHPAQYGYTYRPASPADRERYEALSEEAREALDFIDWTTRNVLAATWNRFPVLGDVSHSLGWTPQQAQSALLELTAAGLIRLADQPAYRSVPDPDLAPTWEQEIQ